MSAEQEIVEQTRCWIETVVVANNFCPFAARVLQHGSLACRVVPETLPEQCLLALAEECQRLDHDSDIETSLLIFPDGWTAFDDYLDLLALAEAWLLDQGYEGEYQLASFHPDYLFDGADLQDPANYTNRSPFPMLHLLRESSIERAVQDFPGVDEIPERNVATARRKGLTEMQALLAGCSRRKI